MSEFLLLPDIKKPIRMTGVQIRLPENIKEEVKTIVAEAKSKGYEITETDVLRTWIYLGRASFWEGRGNATSGRS